MNSSNLEERNSEQNDSFKLQIFKQKGVISISESNFQLLKKGKYLKSTEKHRISPKEENLIINQLHPEILFMICEYLSPGAFTRLGITCKYFQDIFNDQTTWRQIAKCYQNFFIFDYLEIKPFYLQDGLSILAFQTPINQEIEKIQIENQKLDFPNLDPTHFKKKNAERGIRLEKYSNNEKIDDSTKEDEFLHHMVPIKASTEEERIKYINLLENPKEEMLEKGRKIYQLFLERKKHWENEMINKKRKDTLNNFQTKEIDFFSPILIILFSFGFSIYFILITLKKEDKIDTKLSYQSLSIMIPLFGFFITQLIETFLCFWSREHKFYLHLTLIPLFMSLLSLLLDIQILLIGLQVDNFIHCSWIYVFIPFIVFFITLSLFLIERKYDFHERWRLWIVPIIIFLFFIPFFVFLGLKLDGKIHWNYRIVFIPLFIQVIFHYLGLFWNGFWKYDLGSQILLFLILPAFWISILILWILYLERKGIHHVYYPLIPIYLLLLFSFIPSYFSITKLVRICFQKD